MDVHCAGSHVLAEAERSLHDPLCALQQTVQDSRVIYGGGYPEMQMAKVAQTLQLPLCKLFCLNSPVRGCEAALGILPNARLLNATALARHLDACCSTCCCLAQHQPALMKVIPTRQSFTSFAL